ncbi:hypothetical protein GALMADRAFT_141530 [Galerina marginata CBS 339.88]|uniref:Extracellular membrane protein CFEM domain-containing protein n=1 Tax=Galerina marginata (strain CBS 339.88) TaxID=685588 RepID=A0A067SUA8_GALM3|nr:hypothetical protein GALMADRAFT_141530 [Galerina marginata CBS 339.88]
MLRYTSFLLVMVAGLLVGRIEATHELSAPAPRVNLERHFISLGRRQTTIPDVPSQCTTVCNPVNTAIASGCPITTCCQSSFEMGYFNCFQCFENAINETDYAAAQQVLDALVSECTSKGFSLQKLTFPGQNPNRTLSSVVIPSSSQTTAPSQSTVFTATPTPPLSQSTVTALPSTTAPGPSPAPTTASGSRSAENGWLGVGITTLLLGACFYFGL